MNPRLTAKDRVEVCIWEELKSLFHWKFTDKSDSKYWKTTEKDYSVVKQVQGFVLLLSKGVQHGCKLSRGHLYYLKQM